MSYVEDITEALIVTLEHTGGLPAQQLAGHAANLDFWIGEVQHALGVIEGYSDRFRKLQDGERRAAGTHGPNFDPMRFGKPLRPSIADHELKTMRRRLSDAIGQVLGRSYKEGFVTEEELDGFAWKLGLDAQELKRKKRS